MTQRILPRPCVATEEEIAAVAEWLRDAIAELRDRNWSARGEEREFDCARFAADLDAVDADYRLEDLASELRALVARVEDGEYDLGERE